MTDAFTKTFSAEGDYQALYAARVFLTVYGLRYTADTKSRAIYTFYGQLCGRIEPAPGATMRSGPITIRIFDTAPKATLDRLMSRAAA